MRSVKIIIMCCVFSIISCQKEDVIEPQPIDIFKVDRCCPKCDSSLVKRKGEEDIFLGCSSWPKCGYTLKVGLDGEEVTGTEDTGEECPDCGGMLKERMSKFGKPFFGCGNYPTCTYIKKDKPSSGNTSEITKVKCTKCNDSLMRKITMN